jgi:hypothetical protein
LFPAAHKPQLLQDPKYYEFMKSATLEAGSQSQFGQAPGGQVAGGQQSLMSGRSPLAAVKSTLTLSIADVEVGAILGTGGAELSRIMQVCALLLQRLIPGWSPLAAVRAALMLSIADAVGAALGLCWARLTRLCERACHDGMGLPP